LNELVHASAGRTTLYSKTFSAHLSAAAAAASDGDARQASHTHTHKTTDLQALGLLPLPAAQATASSGISWVQLRVHADAGLGQRCTADTNFSVCRSEKAPPPPTKTRTDGQTVLWWQCTSYNWACRRPPRACLPACAISWSW